MWATECTHLFINYLKKVPSKLFACKTDTLFSCQWSSSLNLYTSSMLSTPSSDMSRLAGSSKESYLQDMVLFMRVRVAVHKPIDFKCVRCSNRYCIPRSDKHQMSSTGGTNAHLKKFYFSLKYFK